jgi:type IV pilus assembly protein PilV
MLMAQYRKNVARRVNPSQGFSLIEVLVTIIILLIGLLGLAGLQGRALTSQMESYQRAQALVLLKDMADRLDANRKNAASYITTSPLGTGGTYTATCNASGVCATTADTDLWAWNNALQGAAETQTGGGNVGAMIGARGCVYQNAAPASGVATTYSIVVAWQGMNNTYAPDVTFAYSAGKCGFNQYMNTSAAVTEALHRTITLPIAVADLL